MASSRLPGKPLVDIEGIPMVIRVAQQATKSSVGRVVIACCEQEVYDVANKYGITAVMTSPSLASGTDRVYQALEKIDPTKELDIIINLQGDMPTINPVSIRELLLVFSDASVEMATLASIIKNKKEYSDNNVVKVVIGKNNLGGNAIYFSRSLVPFGEGPVFHHIGIYAFKRKKLEEFVNLEVSQLEKRESLEQLRALEAGMSIYVKVIDEVPIGVDTASDLSNVRKYVKDYDL